MRMHQDFKKDEAAESEEFDELSDDVEELIGYDLENAEEVASAEDDSDNDPSYISDCSYYGSDSTSMDSNDDDGEDDDDKADEVKRKKYPVGSDDIPNKKLKIENDLHEDAPSCSANQKINLSDLNELDEDDDTIRAIISAIKKKRDHPPEIKIEDFITDICFHPEQDIIAIATITGDVCIYKYSNEGNVLLRTIEVHAKACRDVEFSEDGKSLITCSKDKCIMITDMETEKLKKFYESAHDDAINKLYVIDENLFATGDDSGTVKVWDARTKNEVFGIKEVNDFISQMLTNDAKKLLLVTSGDGYLSTINIGARKLYVQSEPYDEEFTCMGLYRGDSKLVVGSLKGKFYTFNWGQFGYHCDMFPGLKSPIGTMIPLTDRIGLVAGEEGVIRACHVAPFRNLGIVGQHSMPIECIDICNSGEFIASSSHNNDVRFWNVKYFEEFINIKYNEKHNTYKEMHHNLPSSKFSNPSDFFADLAKAPDED